MGIILWLCLYWQPILGAEESTLQNEDYLSPRLPYVSFRTNFYRTISDNYANKNLLPSHQQSSQLTQNPMNPLSPKSKTINFQKNGLYSTELYLKSYQETSSKHQNVSSVDSMLRLLTEEVPEQEQYPIMLSTDPIIVSIGAGLIYWFTFIRLLLVISTVSLKLPIFTYIILYHELVLIAAFFPDKKYALDVLFGDILNSDLDALNIIRKICTSFSQKAELTTVLGKHGFSTSLLVNLSGEYILLLIFLIEIVALELIAVFRKRQSFRVLVQQSKSTLNILIFLLIPRFLTQCFWSISLTLSLGFQNLTQLINMMHATLLLLFIIVFCVLNCIWTKKLIEKGEKTSGQLMSFGTLIYLDDTKIFKFDYIKFSVLYFPIVTVIKLILILIPIAISDSFYVLYGVPIAMTIVSAVFHVHSPSYKSRRYQVCLPLWDLLLMFVYMICLAVTMFEEIYYYEVCLHCQQVLLMLLVILGLYCILILILDIVAIKKANFLAPQLEKLDNQEMESIELITNQSEPDSPAVITDLDEIHDKQDFLLNDTIMQVFDMDSSVDVQSTSPVPKQQAEQIPVSSVYSQLTEKSPIKDSIINEVFSPFGSEKPITESSAPEMKASALRSKNADGPKVVKKVKIMKLI